MSPCPRCHDTGWLGQVGCTCPARPMDPDDPEDGRRWLPDRDPFADFPAHLTTMTDPQEATP